MQLLRKHLWTAACILLAVAAAKSGWDLGRVILLEAKGAVDSDSALYFTVGRGILNGRVPYVDLFESKPPGMFLLAALSLLLTGDETLALAAQLFVLAALPALLAAFAWNETKREPRSKRAALALAALTAGTALSLYLEERAGGIQSESFGAFFGVVFLLLAARRGKYDWKNPLVLAVPLLFAIGIKEPFLLSILAGAVVVLGFTRRLAVSFLIPLVVAGVAGVAVMAAAGWLGPYVGTYLPSLGGHVDSGPLDPTIIRGFTPGRLFGNLTKFYTAPLFGWLIAAAWLLLPLLNDKRRAALLDVALTLVQSAVTYASLLLAFFFLVTLNIARLGYELANPIVPISGALYALLLAATAALIVAQWKRGRLRETLEAIVAIYLAAATVGISIYAKNHFAFAVPFYAALLLAFFRYAARSDARAAVVWPVIALALAGALAYAPSSGHLKELADRTRYASAAHRGTVAKADALLTACGEDRYGGVRVYDRLAFSRHSPFGPLIHPPFFTFMGEDHALFRETRRRIAEEATVVFQGDVPDDEELKAILRDRFSETAPDCAKPHLPIEGMTVLFRENT